MKREWLFKKALATATQIFFQSNLKGVIMFVDTLTPTYHFFKKLWPQMHRSYFNQI
jgi:hypothetical protein